jgi:hypothetical protein
MADLIVEPGTPDWWGRAVLQLRAVFVRPTAPSKLWQAANTAALPKASAFPGSIAFNVALGVPVMSDGVFWYPMSVGAHL